MTKKLFKSKCAFHEYGYGQKKHNAIYYDWQEPTNPADRRGFKYGVAASIEVCNKAELLKHFYNWVIDNIEPPIYVRYKYAKDATQRFKTPIVLTW